MSTDLMATLREAETVAWEAVWGDRDAADKAHRLIIAALQLVEAAQHGQRCEASSCENVVEYSGVGRPARFCSRSCRDRAAYVARRQRGGQLSPAVTNLG